MNQQLPAPAPATNTEKTLVALSWASVVLGLIGCVLIPQPFLNNTGALLGVVGGVAAVAGMFSRLVWLPIGGLILSAGAVVGTLAMQAHWADQLNNLPSL